MRRSLWLRIWPGSSCDGFHRFVHTCGLLAPRAGPRPCCEPPAASSHPVAEGEPRGVEAPRAEARPVKRPLDWLVVCAWAVVLAVAALVAVGLVLLAFALT
jgi:hypothetical protein